MKPPKPNRKNAGNADIRFFFCPEPGCPLTFESGIQARQHWDCKHADSTVLPNYPEPDRWISKDEVAELFVSWNAKHESEGEQ